MSIYEIGLSLFPFFIYLAVIIAETSCFLMEFVSKSLEDLLMRLQGLIHAFLIWQPDWFFNFFFSTGKIVSQVNLGKYRR